MPPNLQKAYLTCQLCLVWNLGRHPEKHRKGSPGQRDLPCAQDGTVHCNNHNRSLATLFPNNTLHVITLRGLIPEKGFRVVHNALVRVVIGVGEEDVPVGRKGPRIHRKSVVLRRDIATLGTFMDARLVVAAIPVSRPHRTQHIRQSYWSLYTIGRPVTDFTD